MSNPFAGFLKIPSRPSTIRPTDREQQLTHQALEQSVAVLQALLGDGDPRRGKAVEFFDSVTITSTGTTLKHQLGRQPRGYFLTYQDTNRVIYSNKEGWTEENVVLYTGAGSGVFSFFLFVLLLAVLLVPGVAQAAECTYGYTQGVVIRLWTCANATETATGATEGDLRFNRDTDSLLRFDGAGWGPVSNQLLLNTDNAVGDAFGRLRTSAPYTLFESQNQYTTSGLLWEDALTAGGTVALLTSGAVRMRVSTSGDKVVRQTRQYFRYRPGKSQFIAATFTSLSSDDADVRRRIGYFDANDGIFYQQVGTSLSICLRNKTSDNCVAQADWNVDPLTGAGPSGYTLNPVKSQILLIDLQYLGVGRVRVGFDLDGVFVVAHEFLNANSVTATYMQTANLPVRYELEATGTVATTHDLYQICATVASEGGVESELGYPRSAGSITAIAVTTRRNVLSIRPKATFGSITNRAQIVFESADLSASTNTAYCELIYNPTLGGVPSWTSAGTNSAVEYDVAGTTITGGDVLASWFVVSGSGATRGVGSKDLSQRLPLTLDQAGANPLILTVACTSLTGTSNVATAVNWRELW